MIEETGESGDGAKGIQYTYSDGVFKQLMEVGDIIFTQKNNTTIDGIGVITGDCVFHEDDKEFPRTRTVR